MTTATKAKVFGGLLVALPMAAFAFGGVVSSPAFVDVAFAGYGQEKVTLCHKGHTLTVAAPAAQAHMGHGDTMGACTI